MWPRRAGSVPRSGGLLSRPGVSAPPVHVGASRFAGGWRQTTDTYVCPACESSCYPPASMYAQPGRSMRLWPRRPQRGTGGPRRIAASWSWSPVELRLPGVGTARNRRLEPSTAGRRGAAAPALRSGRRDAQRPRIRPLSTGPADQIDPSTAVVASGPSTDTLQDMQDPHSVWSVAVTSGQMRTF